MLTLGIIALASVRNTDHKTDHNLRSSARINPVTQAMEFSLPLLTYPGRNGQSTPIGFNYSSKSWTMRLYDFKRVFLGGSGTYTVPYQYKYFTSYMPEFGERTLGGWTSSLNEMSIIPDSESFLPDGSDNLLAQNLNSDSCQIISYDWQSPTQACPWGKLVVNWRCSSCRLEKECDDEDHQEEFCWDLGEQDGGPMHPPDLPFPDIRVNRLRLALPDGTTHEFRKDDKIYDCNYMEQCSAALDKTGTFLSVDGSGLRLVDEVGPNNSYFTSTLIQPGGGRVVIHRDSPVQEHIDGNGNRSTYNTATRVWTDNMGREITNPLPTAAPSPGTHTVQLPGMDNQAALNYTQTWRELKPAGCSTGNEPECANSALEHPQDSISNQGTDTCQERGVNHPLSPSLFTVDPDVRDPIFMEGNRYFDVTRITRTCGGMFNPILLTEIGFPDGTKYQFRYNRFGEMTKIIYPTGGYERFRYEIITPLSYLDYPLERANRGVVERWVSEDGINEQHWSYPGHDPSVYDPFITAPDGSKTKTLYHPGGGAFGLENPTGGMPYDEQVYANDGSSLISRTLTEYVSAPARTGGDSRATRDARPSRTVTIIFENQKALASLVETVYDDAGSTDPEFFSHLNIKRTKSYGYVSVDPSTAALSSLTWQTVSGWFSGATPATVSETDYSYNSDYKAHGILGLPIRTRVLNPQTLDPNNPLSLSEIIYDNALPASSSNYTYSMQSYGTGNSMDCSSDPQTPKICWQNPNGASANIDLTYRGLPTTTRTWYAEGNTWIETHTQYDQFGNVVKIKDPLENESQTIFDAQYKYAYATSKIAPAADPTNTHGTSDTSTTHTLYDFNTGLPLSVTDDFGQATTTEHDVALRPIRVNPVLVNGSATGPKTETIYGIPDPNTSQFPTNERFVKVRKQLDANNWDEAITWFDGLGRTIKTQARDSQGDVFVETHYDEFGRVDRVTNPYRAGDTIYWNKKKYDPAGRVVETYAPTELSNLVNAQSLGTTAFDISTINNSSGNFIGTVVVTTDASARKSRSITNALGQLIRLDEPTGIGGNETADLGTLASPNQPTIYKYSPEGKMVQVTQGVQNRYFKYDSLGRLLRASQPEQIYNDDLTLTDSYNTSGHWTAGFGYDISGNIIRATDANGVNIINEYDKATRVIRRCYTKPNVSLASSIDTCAEIPTGDRSTDTSPVEFFYDGKGLASEQSPNFAKGSLTKVTSSVSETRYRLFDNFGQLKEIEQRTPVGEETIQNTTPYVSKYTYSLSGAHVEEEYPSGRKVRNEFESDGNLFAVKSVKAGGGALLRYASNFSNTAAGGVTQMQLGNLLWETAKFNERLQVYELGLGTGPTNTGLWKTNYEYGELDGSGNVVTSKNTGNIARQTLTVPGTSFVQSYKYDSLYRLTEAVEKTGTTQNWIQNWDYDRYGNRLSFTQNIAGNTNATNPAVDPDTNRFTSTNFQYDLSGNVTRDIDPVTSLSRTFVFNGNNKPSEVKDANGLTIGHYYYDGEGKRVKKVVGSETTVFVYSSGRLIAEYSTQAEQNPAVHFTTTDHLGSPRIITDQFGQVTSRRDFMPFGEEIDPSVGNRSNASLQYSSGDSVRQTFTGYQKDDETSLDFAEARMYENRYGRFTAIDPLLASGKLGDPQSFNRYSYVENNPLSFTDKSGTCRTGQCPRFWRGTVYTRTDADGKVWYNNERPDDSWTVLPVGSVVLITDEATATRFWVYNLGEDTNGGSGWYYVDNDRSLMDTTLTRWRERNFIGSGFEDLPTKFRGGRDTIEFGNPETDPDRYRDSKERNLAFALVGGMQNFDLSGPRSVPALPAMRPPFSPPPSIEESTLIGVPDASLNRLTARLGGLNIGGNKVFNNIEAFGSRAGSTFQGRGPLLNSDLDIMLTPNQPMWSYSFRNQRFLNGRLRQISSDFQLETGYPVRFSFDHQRRGLQGPFIPLR
jgi:RHS repeat-associated protein